MNFQEIAQCTEIIAVAPGYYAWKAVRPSVYVVATEQALLKLYSHEKDPRPLSQWPGVTYDDETEARRFERNSKVNIERITADLDTGKTIVS